MDHLPSVLLLLGSSVGDAGVVVILLDELDGALVRSKGYIQIKGT